jgi:Glycosyl hydrolases family 39
MANSAAEESEMLAHNSNPNEMRMQTLYGVNQADECWDFAIGPHREQIAMRLREIDTRMIRLFLFDKHAPDPVREWPVFASYVQAVLKVGAKPMITFGRFHRPFDDRRAVRSFAGQCADVVWSCIEHWGGEVVRDWYWCVLNEPNNGWISGGLTFEQYRRIYEALAHNALRWLSPHLNGRKPFIGGPAVEGFQPFWWDWIWRFVNEIDNSLIGFVDWHRYADWRDIGENGAPHNDSLYKALMMSVASDYESRAREIGKVLQERDILNICGELNTHSHYTEPVRARFNHSIFGAAFYIAALLRLIRGGVDVEMYWTGTEDTGGYGMMNKYGAPWPVFYAKKLCAQYVQYGDWISFPTWERPSSAVDVVVARGENGRRSALLVHTAEGVATYPLAGLDADLKDCDILLKIDGTTGNLLRETSCDGMVTFEGYGVAVVTNARASTRVDGQVTWS